MKSTYSTTITATICYDKAEWQVRFTFPAGVDCDEFESYLEDIESHEALPSVDDMLLTILQDYYFDDEPDIKAVRIYKLSLKEYNHLYHSFYEDDDEMFAEASDSVQQSFCRNCGAEGRPTEPDTFDGICESCGQNTVQSLAVAMGIL